MSREKTKLNYINYRLPNGFLPYEIAAAVFFFFFVTCIAIWASLLKLRGAISKEHHILSIEGTGFAQVG